MKKVSASNLLQKKYIYYLSEPIGKNFDMNFNPDLTPKDMLRLGIFDGYYGENSYLDEFPRSWFIKAKISTNGPNVLCNYFKVHASQPLSVWQKNGWIYKDDPFGWFQWYCRYYMGRRLELEDKRQIKRWKMMVRHVAQVSHKCRRGDETCNIKQRQALLHWAYDSRNI